jgi:hypothetical protein
LAEQAKPYLAAEEKLWREAGKLTISLAKLFDRLLDEVWLPREQHRADLAGGEFAALIHASEGSREKFEGVWQHPIRPMPASFADFLRLLAEICADPSERGYHDPDGLGFDAEGRLAKLLPDLRDAQTKLIPLQRWNPWIA